MPKSHILHQLNNGSFHPKMYQYSLKIKNKLNYMMDKDMDLLT